MDGGSGRVPPAKAGRGWPLSGISIILEMRLRRSECTTPAPPQTMTDTVFEGSLGTPSTPTARTWRDQKSG